MILNTVILYPLPTLLVISSTTFCKNGLELCSVQSQHLDGLGGLPGGFRSDLWHLKRVKKVAVVIKFVNNAINLGSRCHIGDLDDKNVFFWMRLESVFLFPYFSGFSAVLRESWSWSRRKSGSTKLSEGKTLMVVKIKVKDSLVSVKRKFW